MEIWLTPEEYPYYEDDIRECLRGEMCKIAVVHKDDKGTDSYRISTDVSQGWSVQAFNSTTRFFHGTHLFVPGVTITGLGTFVLISCVQQEDGRYLLTFTPDLNPDLP